MRERPVECAAERSEWRPRRWSCAACCCSRWSTERCTRLMVRCSSSAAWSRLLLRTEGRPCRSLLAAIAADPIACSVCFGMRGLFGLCGDPLSDIVTFCRPETAAVCGLIRQRASFSFLLALASLADGSSRDVVTTSGIGFTTACCVGTCRIGVDLGAIRLKRAAGHEIALHHRLNGR